MILTAEQLLPLADLVREHEVTDIHVGRVPQGLAEAGHVHADLYRQDEQGWRVTAVISDVGHVTTFGPGVAA